MGLPTTATSNAFATPDCARHRCRAHRAGFAVAAVAIVLLSGATGSSQGVAPEQQAIATPWAPAYPRVPQFPEPPPFAPVITRLPPIGEPESAPLPAAAPPRADAALRTSLSTGAALSAGAARAPSYVDPAPLVIAPNDSPPGGATASQRSVESVALLPPSADGPIFFANPRDSGVPYSGLAEEDAAVGGPVTPPGFKNGMWQFTTFRKTFLLPGPRNSGFGMEDLLLQTTIALPFFTREKPIFITPYFQAHILQGPVPVDLPPQLYDVSLEFRILRQLNPKWGMDLALAPAILSDFQNMTHQAYRLTGRGVFLYTWSDTVQVAGGVTVTGRQDVPILPVGGVIWTPGPNWRTEAIFPRPRILRHLVDTQGAAWWMYTAGEFGGNSYAIERASGVDDLATYRDLRFELGVERKTPAGGYNRFEVGYVFDREISYLSGTPSYAPSNTVMLRGEATF